MNDRNWGGHRPGSGRKKLHDKYVKFSVYMSETEALELKKRAKDMDMSVSIFIRTFLHLIPETLEKKIEKRKI